MKRAVTVLLTLLLLSSSLLAFARADYYIESYFVGCAAQGSGKIKVTANVTAADPNMTEIGFPAIELYESTNGTSWTPVVTQTDVYKPNAPYSDYTYSFTHTGIAGRYYYAAASYYVGNNNGGSTRYSTSGKNPPASAY